MMLQTSKIGETKYHLVCILPKRSIHSNHSHSQLSFCLSREGLRLDFYWSCLL